MAFEGATPDGWETTRLGEVATLRGGTTPAKNEPKYWEGGVIPWATPTDITAKTDGVRHICETENHITDVAAQECSLSLNPPGTVLMTSRASIGFVAINAVPMATNQGFIAFHAGKQVSPEFLYYWLQGNRRLLESSSGGSTFRELSRGTAKTLPISLPPLTEQKKIAEILDAVDDAIAKTKAVEAATIRTAQAALDQILDGNGVYDTTKWSSAKCEDVCTAIKVGIASAATHAFTHSGVPLIRNQNIKDGWLDREDFLFVTKAYDEENKTKRVKTGDIITMRTGYPGRSAIVTEDLNNCQTFTTLVSRPNQSIVTPDYLCMWYNSAKGRRLIKSLQAGGAQQNLNAGVLKRMPITIPPLEVQNEIAKFDRMLRRPSEGIKNEVVRLEKLKTGLMADLLSGRKRVV